MSALSRDPYAPAASDIRSALGRVCASRPFDHSPRLSAFLRFVIEATLSGQAGRLKGYTIGIEALGRSESFDPQIDPIVRVEATRLRHALARYYANEGARDPVLIELPRGRYVPQFRWRAPPGRGVPGLLLFVRKAQRLLDIRLTLHMPSDRR
jgi:hypothetical protein